MLCTGGEKEWAQMMGERALVIPANTSSSNSSAACSGSKNSLIRANSGAAINAADRVADKPPPAGAQDHLPPPAAALRCPRCDSSNTKFCYYNNYSLSQPRHFCKACKRYWTRGGTLRNVPVGGGCRKNKRCKKPPAAAAPPSLHPQIPSLSAAPRSAAAAASHLDAAAAAAMFAMPILPHGLSASTSTFDLAPHHLGALGLLGELQPLPATESCSAAMSSTLLSDYPPLYGLSSSLLMPSISKQPKQAEDYQVLLPFEELQASEMCGITINGMMKEVKLESAGQHNTINSCMDWQIPVENYLDSFAPPASIYWNGGSAGWPDGVSSVAPPLI